MEDPTKRRPGATSRASALRQDDTEPEYRLWGELRNRRLNGYKFARQIPIGPYYVDFVCRDARLVIELDGGQHSESRIDVIRDAYLMAQGYSVLRFWNDEVLKERRAALETILAALDGRLSPSPGLRFAPATLSPGGEEATNRRAQHKAIEERLKTSYGKNTTRRPPLPSGERVAAQRPGEGALEKARSDKPIAQPRFIARSVRSDSERES